MSKRRGIIDKQFLNQIRLRNASMSETSQLNQKQITLWNHLKESSRIYHNAIGTKRNELDPKERIELIRWAIKNQDRSEALRFMEFMKPEERKELVDVLIGFTNAGGRWREFVTKLILEIPRDWLVENIEKYTEPILDQFEDYTDYSGFLWVLHEIDQQLAIRLAERAQRSSNFDIHEIGEFYLTEYLEK
jgi:hypothetical protein